VIRVSACGACHAKGVCSPEQASQVITVKSDDPRFVVGSKVTIVIEQKTGDLAVFFAYFLPLIIFIAMFCVFLLATRSEGLAGLLALFSLAPYFSSLWVFRERMNHSFKVYIKS